MQKAPLILDIKGNSLYYDIKILDPDIHQQFCGVKNDRILKSFSKLNTLSTENSFKLLARTPLIPNITATEKNLRQIAIFLKTQGVRKARLLAYNPLWHEKMLKSALRTHLKITKKFVSGFAQKQ